MKLKLDLHPIFSEGRHIETALQSVIDEACEKRAAEIEIIPGKGSGQLKKSVLRFLDRPEVKARYHRIEKDSDNWGRLFVHFRWDKAAPDKRQETVKETTPVLCFCCNGTTNATVDRDSLADNPVAVSTIDCPGCGSPNRVTIRADRRGNVRASSEPGYE